MESIVSCLPQYLYPRIVNETESLRYIRSQLAQEQNVLGTLGGISLQNGEPISGEVPQNDIIC